MANFSSALKITDVNDFIAPSQDCVVLDQSKASLKLADTDDTEIGQVQIQSKSIPSRENNEPVKISLHDCLACSGCVTTAETILLEHQSIDQFKNKLGDKNCRVVVSISLQTLASISDARGIGVAEVGRKLSWILRQHGAFAVFDLSIASEIALLENCLEFERRLRNGEKIPMMASACPGWICYVEKSQPHLIPYISSVKSPQGIMGTLVKQFWSSEINSSPQSIFHVAIMPCYDKKLESVREELMVGNVPETDCVLTTGELEKWLDDINVNLSDTKEESFDVFFDDASDLGDLMDCDNASICWPSTLTGDDDPVGSGGYLSHLARYMSLSHGLGRIPLKQGRNADIAECQLDNGQNRINFAIINGFRNIQGLVRKMKLGKCHYHFVEVMACPSGCVNGGGQLPVETGRTEALGRMEKSVHAAKLRGSDIVKQCDLIYNRWIRDMPGSMTSVSKFTTSLKERKARFGYTHALVSDRGTTRVPLRQPFVKFHANQSSHCGGILGADALTLCLAVPQGQRSLVEENVRDVVVRVYNVSVSAPKDPGKDDFDVHQELLESIRKKLKLRSTKPLAEHGNVAIVRKAFDSRDKSRKKWIYVVDIPLRALDGKKIVESQGKIEIMEVCKDHVNWNRVSNGQASKKSDPVVVVGSGPAGLFAALSIAKSGIPVTILERGRPVEDRGRDIGALFARKKLNPESNLCYGEGGAGTWSDGKLTTRIGRNNDPVRQVLETLCLFGAPNAILYSGKPHLGTDRLIGILRSFRHHLRDLGVKIEFESKVKTLEIKNGRVVGVLLEDGTGFSCQKCILAVGHSARQMYEHLADLGVKMEAKPFAMGFRIEHPQAVIDAIQYGKEDAENLVKRGKGPIPVADYKLTTNLSDRGIYSFCMCPGGQIVPTSTNEAELCINGMSFSKRNSIWANSALVATISETDWEPFENGHPALSGVNLQKHIERRAAHMGGGNLICPVQRVVDFLSDRESVGKLPSSSYRLGVKSASLHTLYSAELTEAIKQALFKFDTIKPGFICEDALLHAAETRTSSPVQITRHPESFESVSIKGLYPAGEGAGYAGGIVSACVDGLKIGNSIVQQVAS